MWGIPQHEECRRTDAAFAALRKQTRYGGYSKRAGRRWDRRFAAMERAVKRSVSGASVKATTAGA